MAGNLLRYLFLHLYLPLPETFSAKKRTTNKEEASSVSDFKIIQYHLVFVVI